ncbi:MAG: phosphatidate cytidylyltransferase [Phycisphaerales bacterium]|nr:phosphatidate cytidylyltransferase [Planctomycetota bacterium]MBL6997560.1 phosphatidate cytidylyltransferase [Phycisphaerales bacterium]
MLRHRLITGPLLSFALIALIYFDNKLGCLTCQCGTPLQPGLLIAILAILVAPLAALEFGAMANNLRIRCNIPMLIISMEAWIIAIYLMPDSTPISKAIAIFSTIFVIGFACTVFSLSKGKQLNGVLAGTTFTVGTAAYVALGFGLLLLIRREHSAWWILGVIAIVKMCDTGAFFVGCNFGKRKLIPWISPAKSWEGLIGGLATASLTAVGLAAANNHWLAGEPMIPLVYAAFLGILFGLLGQLGDLLMSVFKRDSGVKDASTVLPGLGGILDVLDSLLIVSPIAYWLLPTT